MVFADNAAMAARACGGGFGLRLGGGGEHEESGAAVEGDPFFDKKAKTSLVPKIGRAHV